MEWLKRKFWQGKEEMRKILLSVLAGAFMALAVTLSLSGTALAATTADVDTYAKFTTAVADAGVDTIRVTGSFTLGSDVIITRPVTITANSIYTIDADTRCIIVGAGGDVTMGGSLAATGSGEPGVVWTQNGGHFTLADSAAISAADGSGIYVDYDSTANISGGMIAASGSFGSCVYCRGSADISGGTLTASGTNGACVYSQYGSVNISGGTFTASGPGSYSVNNFGADVTIGGSAQITGKMWIQMFSTLNITSSDSLSVGEIGTSNGDDFLTSFPASVAMGQGDVKTVILDGVGSTASFTINDSSDAALNATLHNGIGESTVTLQPAVGVTDGDYSLVLTGTSTGTLNLTIPVSVRAFSGGSGEPGSPWQITTAAQLNRMRYYPDKCFELGADIDLAASPYSAGWTPIGTSYENSFSGTFNGKVKTVSGLYINQPDQNYIGLFGYVCGAVENLDLDSVNVTGSNHVGSLAGKVNVGSAVTGCSATGSVTATGDSADVGGLVGENNGTITSCSAAAKVTATGTADAGGLVGYNSALIQQSYATGSVQSQNAGGLIGINSGVISNCYATGGATGHRTGGLVATHYGGDVAVIEYCYAAGAVSGDEAGGLVGSNWAVVTDSFYNSQTTGQPDDGNGLTSANMVQEATFTTGGSDWDFTDVWAIDEGTSYPYLQGNAPAAPPTPPAPDSVTVSVAGGSSFPLTYGGVAGTLRATITGDPSALDTVTWTSSDDMVATVSAGGVVTPRKAGTATIRATTVLGGHFATFDVTVNKKPIAITGEFTAQSKVYDGTVSTAFGITNTLALKTDDTVGSDVVTLNAIPTFADTNAGTGKTVSLATSTLSGAAKDNYTLSFTGAPTATADITPVTLTIGGSFTAQGKTYDGTAAAAIATNNLTLTGVLTGDTNHVSLTPVLTFADVSVGTGKTVSLTSVSSFGGAAAGNYILSLTGAPTYMSGAITPKALTVTGAQAQNKVYDGNTGAIVNGAALSGVVSGDTITLENSTAGTFVQKGIGNGITVTTTMSVSGDDAGNYSLTQPTLTANITAKSLTVTGATAQDKVYDGNTHAAITGATLSGVVDSDNVTLGNKDTGTFTQKEVGTGIAVTTSMTITGGDAGNYNLTQPTLTANITPKALSVTGATAQNKTYDGSTNAAIIGAALSGVVTGDTVMLGNSAAGTFAQKDVGTGIAVTTNMTITGGDAGNYTLPTQPTLTANIDTQSITVTADVKSKVYGDSDPALTYQITAGSLVSGDSLTGALSRGSGEDVDTYDIDLGSLTATSNYILNYSGATLTITARPLTITADAKSKTVGASDPALTYSITSGSLAGSDQITGALTREPGESAGTYQILQGTLAAGANYDLTYVGAAFTISAASTDGGGGGTPTQSTTPIVGSGGSITAAPPTLNQSTGVATTQISSTDLNAALSKAAADSEGKKTVAITVPPVQNANGYETSLPTGALSSSASTQLAINTAIATVTLPGNMLTQENAGASGVASLNVAQADVSALSQEARDQIGDRPVIQLTLTINGQQTEWSNPDAPVTVSIPYTPTAAELANPDSIVVWYIDGSGNLVSIPNGRYDPATGMVTFRTTHFSDYAVGYNKVSFSDVAASAWYNKAVSFIAARNITSGTSSDTFSPDAQLTRGQFIVMLMKAHGIAPDANATDNFSDAGNTYYTNYLAAAKRLGISAGVGNNRFAPEQKVTRQEMFTLLYNALKVIGQLPQGDSGKILSDFADSGDIATWAKDGMTLLVETGTIGGNAGMLTPTSTTTRAEMAQVLYNLLSK